MAQDASKKLQLVPHACGCGLPTAMGLKCMQAGTTGWIEIFFPTQAARWRRIFATAPNPAPNTVKFATKFVANVWGVRGGVRGGVWGSHSVHVQLEGSSKAVVGPVSRPP